MKQIKLLVLLCSMLLMLAAAAAETRAKYVFLFIGDGMGENIRKYYQNQFPDSALEKFPVIVHTNTRNCANGVTDSAASGTAIACGIKTYNSAIGVDKDKQPVTSLAKIMRDKGYSIGIITSVGLNDATPSAHYANRLTRKDHSGIKSDLFASNFDFFAGGFMLHNRNYRLADYTTLLKQTKYTFVDNYNFTEKTPRKRVVFVASMEPDWPAAPQKRHLLSEVTAFAIDSLKTNPKGFFMLVEGGAIDHRAHGNDLAGVMREMREFDTAVKTALEFQKKHPKETLIVVTSDHDTGGLDIVKYPNHSLWQKQPFRAGDAEKEFKKKFKTSSDTELIKYLIEYFGLEKLTADEEKIMQKALKDYRDPELRKKTVFRSMYGKYNPVVIQMMRIRDARCGINWKGFGHTSRLVLTNAKGAGEEHFKSVKENSDIPHAISRAVFGEDLMVQAARTMPYLQPSSRFEEYFKFITLNSTKAVFRYGQKNERDLEFTFKGPKMDKQSKRSDRAGRLTYENLVPGSEYTMTVKCNGKVIAERKIKTLPATTGKKIVSLGIVSDPHVSAAPDVRYGRMHSLSEYALTRACQKLAKQKVDYIVLPGDVTDASKMHELKTVAKALGATKNMRYLAVPGNHDRLKARDFKKLWNKLFGATARLEKHGKLQLLLLDTGNGKLADKAANIKAIEALDPALPVIVFSHYQLTADSFIKDKDKAISDAPAAEALLKKLSGMKGMIMVGHKNVATTAKLGKLCQVNMPQLTQFPAGVIYAEVFTDGIRLEFQPMLSPFHDENGRIRGCIMGQKVEARDKNSLQVWNAFYPMDLTAGL